MVVKQSIFKHSRALRANLWVIDHRPYIFQLCIVYMVMYLYEFQSNGSNFWEENQFCNSVTFKLSPFFELRYMYDGIINDICCQYFYSYIWLCSRKIQAVCTKYQHLVRKRKNSKRLPKCHTVTIGNISNGILAVWLQVNSKCFTKYGFSCHISI